MRIASLEDKIVQRAVVEVLNAIYEMDFLGFSYGFRPGRGQHMALDALATGIRRKKVNWVLRCRHSWILRCHRPRMAAADGDGSVCEEPELCIPVFPPDNLPHPMYEDVGVCGLAQDG